MGVAQLAVISPWGGGWWWGCAGEVQYSARVEDIRILKLEIKKMRRERAILSKSVSNVDDLK